MFRSLKLRSLILVLINTLCYLEETLYRYINMGEDIIKWRKRDMMILGSRVMVPTERLD